MTPQPQQDEPAVTVIREKRHGRLRRWQLALIARRVLRDPRAGADAADRYLAGLDGELPTADGRTGTILVACDAVYLRRFAPSFLASLRNAGVQHVHLHVCDGPSAADAGLNDVARGLALSITSGTHSEAPALRYPTVHYTAARFLLLHAILGRTGAPVLCMDIDALFRRSPWPLLAPALGEHDLVLTERPEWKQATRRTLAGVVAVNRTEAGRAFAGALSRALHLGLATGPLYHLDQITMTYLIDRMRARGTIAIAPLPDGFLTRDGDDDAVAFVPKGWSGKASDGFERAQEAAVAAARRPT